MNKARRTIWNKSGGKCWYCGCDLSEKGWHADHFEPIRRDFKYISGVGFRTTGECDHPERDNEDNKVPACASCNIQKSSNSLEGFRRSIQDFVNSLNSYHNQYKFAKKYGLVQETNEKVQFWFEKHLHEVPSERPNQPTEATAV